MDANQYQPVPDAKLPIFILDSPEEAVNKAAKKVNDRTMEQYNLMVKDVFAVSLKGVTSEK